MQGDLVKLQALEPEDYKLFAECLRPSKVSALALGTQDFLSIEEIEKNIKLGNTRYATVLTHENEKIGFISWQSQKYEGNYLLGGVIVDQSKWDQGYGAEASLLILEFLFHAKNAHRVQFINAAYNKRTVGFLIKNKVKIEGILRDHLFLDGEYHDAVISSILRDEYYTDDSDFSQDTIPRNEKNQIRKELYEYLEGQWKEENLVKK